MWHIYSKYDLIICKEVDSHWPSQLGQQAPLFIPFKLVTEGQRYLILSRAETQQPPCRKSREMEQIFPCHTHI